MQPRHMLNSDEMKDIVNTHLKKQKDWEERTITTHTVPYDVTLTYFYNKNKNYIVVAEPLAVKNVADSLDPDYDFALQKIKDDFKAHHEENNDFGIICSVLGKGNTEGHYMTLFKEAGKNGEISVFDSKITDNDRFFKSADAPNFLERAWGFITAPFRTFFAAIVGRAKQESTFLSQKVTVYRSGEQSVFDGKSCGLFATGAMMKMMEKVEKEDPKDRKTFIPSMAKSIMNKKLDLEAEKIHQSLTEKTQKNKIKNSASLPPVSTALGKLTEHSAGKVHTNDHSPKVNKYNGNGSLEKITEVSEEMEADKADEVPDLEASTSTHPKR